MIVFSFFFFNDTATTEIYTLSYTTLFRSLPRPGAATGLHAQPGAVGVGVRPVQGAGGQEEGSVRRGHRGAGRRPVGAARSEEHTSELQSRQYLVCRLLLEKKKKHQIDTAN